VDGAEVPVLPDCCNPGVALRVVLLLLAGITMGALLVAEHLAAWSTLMVANLSLASVTAGGTLTSLCFLRPFVVGRSRVLQWAVGLGVPAAFMGLGGAMSIVFGAATPLEPWLWVGLRVLASVAASFAILNHFQLRARAYSPSLSEARLIALQARIRPHFLFNSLNTVLGLLRSDPRQAESTLQDLAELFRVFMRDTRELVPLSAEIETCRQYLAIETLRLNPRLQVRWALANLPMDALVPSLLIQPLIENAVHHGIEPLAVAGQIEISGRLRADRIRIEIINPLPPKGLGSSRMGNQMALSNVRERLMLLFDMEAELRMDTEGDRFRLTLDFPYRSERRGRHD
jgi:two-component system sensor histidine kinase AlgZ